MEKLLDLPPKFMLVGDNPDEDHVEARLINDAFPNEPDFPVFVSDGLLFFDAKFGAPYDAELDDKRSDSADKVAKAEAVKLLKRLTKRLAKLRGEGVKGYVTLARRSGPTRYHRCVIGKA